MKRIGLGCLVAAVAVSGCARWEPVGDREPPVFETDPGSTRRDAGPGEEDPTFPPAPLPPSLDGPSVTAADPPPPISGGTLLALRDGTRLVAADPDRDRLLVVSTIEPGVTASLGLSPGDEPGRLVEDGDGRVHVALRRGGAVVSFDPSDVTTAERRSVCAMPRGIAFEPSSGLLHVACRGGELVSLHASGGAPVRTVHLERDLRDVVLGTSGLVVSTFRSAELLHLDGAGSITRRTAPVAVEGLPTDREGLVPVFQPSVAWRTVPLPGGGFAMSHQRATSATVVVEPGGYGGFDMCRAGGIVHSAISLSTTDGAHLTGPAVPFAVLPVDLAVNAAGDQLAVVAASRNEMFPSGNVFVYARSALATDDPCGHGREEHTVDGEPIAVAFDASARVWVQTRQPSALIDVQSGVRIDFGGADANDTGHLIFHMGSGAFLACASCHAEGADDGRVWTFEGLGERRTQTMEGGILGTEPFHWSGDMADLNMLLHEVLTGRMSGPGLRPDHVEALGAWVDTIPAPTPSPPSDPEAVARGEVIFHDEAAACASCHAGPHLTSNATVDVGTGGPFQVPRLVGVAFRAPYLHSGCAETLEDRFGPCGGADSHGTTSHLPPARIADLVAYLETL